MPLAEIARPHGVVGELRVKVYHEGSTQLSSGRRVRLRFKDGTERDAVIASARPVTKALLVKIAGVDSRNEAEALRGVQLCVPRAELPEPDDGEFYVTDVIGATVELADGSIVGAVRDLVTYPSCDVLLIDRPGMKALEVPLVDAFVTRVDTDAKKIVLSTIDGLDV